MRTLRGNLEWKKGNIPWGLKVRGAFPIVILVKQ